MQVLNYSDFRTNLKSHLDQVSNDNDTIILNRGKNENVVLISLQEYNSIFETLHLLKSEKNRKRLEESIDRDNNGEFLVKDIFEIT